MILSPATLPRIEGGGDESASACPVINTMDPGHVHARVGIWRPSLVNLARGVLQRISRGSFVGDVIQTSNNIFGRKQLDIYLVAQV